MSRTVSPSSQQPYGVARVTSVWNLARSTFYAARQRQRHPREPQRRGPKVLSDEERLAEICELLAQPVFTAEGYRKIRARLRHKGVRTSKDRVLRLLREQQLLSPSRQPETTAGDPHEGTILTAAPNQMWGTDATASFTEAEGTVTIFAALDHCTAECVGIYAVKKATRFEALEPIRQAVMEQFGAFSSGVAVGLKLRHDHGSVYMSDDFQSEITFLGMEPSPPFVRQPEGNARAENFLKTLKVEEVYCNEYETLEQAAAEVGHFIAVVYNEQRLHSALGYVPPAEFEAAWASGPAAAAVGAGAA